MQEIILLQALEMLLLDIMLIHHLQQHIINSKWAVIMVHATVTWLEGDSAGKLVATDGDVVTGKVGGTNFTGSILIGHKTTWNFKFS